MEAFMRARLMALAAVSSLAAAGAALAHHGWGSYDAGKPFTIRSPVEKLRWENPHVHIDLKHQGATWEAVLAPPFRMDARGLNPDMLKAGAMVAVEGYRSTRVEREMRAERITVGAKTFELR
jgi:hypothetical protein